MAKKFGKFLAFATIAGAAAAGIYYFLNKKDEDSCDCDDDFDHDIEDFFDDEKEKAAASREYVSLNKSAEAAKDTIKNVVTEAVEESKEKAAEAAEGVGLVKDNASEAAEFAFKEFKDGDDAKEEG